MSEMQLLKEKTKFYFLANKYKLLLLYIVTALSNLINLIPLYLFGATIDYALDGNLNKVINTIALIVLLFIVTSTLSIIETILHSYINQNIIIHSKEEIYNKILKLKRKDFNALDNGQLMSKIENDSVYIANFITEDIIEIIISIITIVISVFFAIKLSLKLSIIALITFPLTVILSNILSKKTRKYISKEKELRDEYFSNIQETFIGIEEIKSLGIEALSLKKYKINLQNIKTNTLKSTWLETKINFLISIITSIGEWLILLVASWMIINNTLTVGVLVAFNSFCGKLTISISQLSRFNLKLQTVLMSLKRLYDLLNITDETVFETNCSPNLQGNVSIKNLDFSYSLEEKILENLNLSIKEKNFYVIVGKNGCGKTSLLNLMLRFFENTKGEIFFDNNNINKIDISCLRRQICYIPQQPYIFNGSIEYNLSLANRNLSTENQIEACKLVGLHEFIQQLPNKYKTIIGKDGINLSGGQKQKLAIARGILKRPRIMILDEITSDLDSKAEVDIMTLLSKLSKKFTIITVAHRISSILYCPNIIVMNNGTIINTGTHEELIENCSVYIELYKEQLKKIEDKMKCKTEYGISS